MRKYDLLLADADGTLLDFAVAEDKALKAACALMGLQITNEDAGRYKAINESLWRAFERAEVTQAALKTLRFARFLETLGVQGDAEVMSEKYVAALSMQADEITGAYDFLHEASLRVPVVIVTNGIASVQRARFARSPLGKLITGHVISGEVGFAKPDPRMIERALEIGQVPRERALMLGDEPASDIAAAVAAGVDSVWFNPSGRENPTGHLPTYEIRVLKEALQWL